MPDIVRDYQNRPQTGAGQAMQGLGDLVETLYQVKLNQEAREALQDYRQATLRFGREELAERARVNQSLIELRQRQGIALEDKEAPEAKFVREQNLRDLVRQADDYVTLVTKVYRDEKGEMVSLPGAPAPNKAQEQSALSAMEQLQEKGYTGYDTYIGVLRGKYPKGKDEEIPPATPPKGAAVIPGGAQTAGQAAIGKIVDVATGAAGRAPEPTLGAGGIQEPISTFLGGREMFYPGAGTKAQLAYEAGGSEAVSEHLAGIEALGPSALGSQGNPRPVQSPEEALQYPGEWVLTPEGRPLQVKPQ